VPNCGNKSLIEIKEAHTNANFKELKYNSFKIESLNLSQRSENILLQNSIKTLKDFSKLDISRIHLLANCGRKSANEIREAYIKNRDDSFNENENRSLGLLRNLETDLLNYSISYLGLSQKVTNVFISNNIKTLKDFSELSMDKLNIIWPESNRVRSYNNLIKEIDVFLNNTSLHEHMKENLLEADETIVSVFDKLFAITYPKSKEWLIKRIFYGFTLQECSKVAGVTRERIRQLESKFFKQVDFELSFDEKNKIKEYLDNNDVIKNVLEMERVDPLFKNISKYLIPASNPAVFFNTIFKKKNIARWEKIEFEYRVFQIKNKSASEIIESYNLNTESHFNLSLKDSIKADCILAGRLDAFEYVYQCIFDKFNNTSSMARYAMARLRFKNPGHPIEIDSIINLISKEFNYNPRQDKRAISSLFQGRDPTNQKTFINGVYPYGKNSFIFLQDAIDENDAKQIATKVIDILLEIPGRQFNLKNVLNTLLNKEAFKNFLDAENIKLTHYLLQVIMRSNAFNINSRVFDHGRLMWSVSESDIAPIKSEKRI
jgi:hypothetical protein